MADITLGGRRFKVIDFDRRTVAQDHYLMTVTRQTGADKVMPMDGDSDDAYIIRLQTCLIDSGKACDLIAGYLLAENETEADWTVEKARDIAKHLRGCSTAEDRELVLSLAMQVTIGFFQLGIERYKRLRSSLSEMEAQASSVAVPRQMH
jgi:hypothetical protein